MTTRRNAGDDEKTAGYRRQGGPGPAPEGEKKVEREAKAWDDMDDLAKFIALFKKKQAKARAETLREIRALQQEHGLKEGTIRPNPEEVWKLKRLIQVYYLLPDPILKRFNDTFTALLLFIEVPELREGIECIVDMAARAAEEREEREWDDLDAPSPGNQGSANRRTSPRTE